MMKVICKKRGYEFMRRYKSIFKEASKSNIVKDTDLINQKDIKKIKRDINILNMQWTEIYDGEMSWDEAIKNAPSGYRLPTIQELFSAFDKKLFGVFGHNVNKVYNFWSCNTSNNIINGAWFVNFLKGSAGQYNKTYDYNVIYVKK